jgi:hypothetical protein
LVKWFHKGSTRWENTTETKVEEGVQPDLNRLEQHPRKEASTLRGMLLVDDTGSPSRPLPRASLTT